MRGPHNAERKLTEPASTPRVLAGLDAAPGDLQRLPQDLAVADMVGEEEDELAVHHFGFGFAQVPLAVDELLVEAVGVGNVGIEVEGQRRSPSGGAGVGDGALDLGGVEGAPARRDVLVGADEIDGAGRPVVTLPGEALHTDEVAALRQHPRRPDLARPPLLDPVEPDLCRTAAPQRADPRRPSSGDHRPGDLGPGPAKAREPDAGKADFPGVANTPVGLHWA